MKSYTVNGGPCHYDITVRLFLFLSKRYRNKTMSTLNGNALDRKIAKKSNEYAKKFQTYLDDFFNPDKKDGDFFLYLIPPCCSFHLDFKIEVAPKAWSNLDWDELQPLLPEGSGVMVVDRLKRTDNPWAKIGGQKMLIGHDSGKYTFVHEVGHLLGLEDQYAVKPNAALGVDGNNMTDEEEAEHVGHLMGKKDNRQRRELDIHEVEDITTALNLTCDEAKCCKVKHPKDRKDGSLDYGKEESEFMIPNYGENENAFVVPEWQKTQVKSRMTEQYSQAHVGAIAGFDLALELMGEKVLERMRPDYKAPC